MSLKLTHHPTLRGRIFALGRGSEGPEMLWNFLFGWLLGTTAGNTGLPESEKQRRYDERRARKASAPFTGGQKVGLVIVGLFLLGALIRWPLVVGGILAVIVATFGLWLWSLYRRERRSAGADVPVSGTDVR